LTRNLHLLVTNDLSESQIHQVFGNVYRALSNRRVEGDRAATTAYLGEILLEAKQMQFEESFHAGKGPGWDAFRKLINDSDAHCAADS
jgi:hypothetical protein